ncbi:MAG: hypothetical protein NVSMB8_03450 [Candidatus Limnocylindrales bacterium]
MAYYHRPEGITAVVVTAWPATLVPRYLVVADRPRREMARSGRLGPPGRGMLVPDVFTEAEDWWDGWSSATR